MPSLAELWRRVIASRSGETQPDYSINRRVGLDDDGVAAVLPHQRKQLRARFDVLSSPAPNLAIVKARQRTSPPVRRNSSGCVGIKAEFFVSRLSLVTEMALALDNSGFHYTPGFADRPVRATGAGSARASVTLRTRWRDG